MSNSLIVFCIALFASATFGLPLDKDQPMSREKAVKRICTRLIYEGLKDMIHKYVSNGLQHVTDDIARAEKIGQFIRAGSQAMGEFVEELHKIQLIDDKELAPMDPEAPVHCPGMVLTELSRIESELLARFDII